MVNKFSFEKCLKLSWIKHVMFSQSKPWQQLLHFTNGCLNHVFAVGGRCVFSKQKTKQPESVLEKGFPILG